MDPKWFTGRLRELREGAGLNRQQLADKAGMSEGGIRDLEQGRRLPSWETVVAICEALGVSCDEFRKKPAADLPPLQAGRPKKATPEAQPEEPAKPKPTRSRKRKK
jgi:transcriptional regulator with XRE-family HTH domain